MNRRRFLAGITLTALTILVTLAGCQDLVDVFPFLKNTPQIAVPSLTIDTQSTLFPVNTPSPTAESPSTFVLWLPPQFDPNSGISAGRILGAQLNQYTSQHPGKTVITRIKAETGIGGLLDTLTTASSAAPAVLPDLVLLSRPDFEKAAKAGLLAPLETTDLPVDQINWFPFSLQLAKVNSSIYGIPFAADTLLIKYKKSMITYPPTDWEGVYKLASPLTFPAGDPLGLTAVMLYVNAGGTFQLENENVALDEKPLQDGLQVLYDGASAEVFQFWMLDQKSFQESEQIFLDSPSAYEVTWSSQFLKNRNENLGIAPIPGIAGESVSLANGWVFAIPQFADEQMTESLDLVKYLTDPAFQSEWSEAAGYIPINPQAFQGWSDQEESSILLTIAESAQVLPDSDILAEVGPLFSEATQDLVKQQVSYIQAANTIITRASE